MGTPFASPFVATSEYLIVVFKRAQINFLVWEKHDCAIVNSHQQLNFARKRLGV